MLTLFKRSRQNAAIARSVYGAIVAQARQRGFYADYGVPDTLEGRFDLLVLHLVVVMERLGRAGEAGSGLSQAIFDMFLTDMDRTMRETGVGDLSVPRKMKAIGQSFYGRWHGYIGPLVAGDEAQLAAAIARNLFPDGVGGSDPGRLAAYALRTRRWLDEVAEPMLLSGQMSFPGAVEASERQS